MIKELEAPLNILSNLDACIATRLLWNRFSYICATCERTSHLIKIDDSAYLSEAFWCIYICLKLYKKI